MGVFNSDLLRALAIGPQASAELKYLFKPNSRAWKAYKKYKDKWRGEQPGLHADSKDLLYATVMLRAADALQRMEDCGAKVTERTFVEVNLCIRIIPTSFNVEENKDEKSGRTGHEPVIQKSTDNKVHVSFFESPIEETEAFIALDRFSRRGLACPPD